MNTTERTFLAEPAMTSDVQQFYDDDIAEMGFVMNVSRLWAHQPHSYEGLFGILAACTRAGSLSFRQRGVLVSAAASARGDAYCSLAWGSRLAGAAGADVASAVLRGSDDELDGQDRLLAAWARRVAVAPGAVTAADVEELHDAGFDATTIFAITLFVALRVAFSTVNDALGARPDGQLADRAPLAVRDAVTFGRSPSD